MNVTLMISQVLEIETLSAAAFGSNFHLICMYLGRYSTSSYVSYLYQAHAPGIDPTTPKLESVL
jgi:uncharacterized protein YqfA (UPF0365 family)